MIEKMGPCHYSFAKITMHTILPFSREENAHCIIFSGTVWGCTEKNTFEYRSQFFPDNLFVLFSFEKGVKERNPHYLLVPMTT
jgi:hypothetical protein